MPEIIPEAMNLLGVLIAVLSLSVAVILFAGLIADVIRIGDLF